MKVRAPSAQIASATAVIVALYLLVGGSPLVAQQGGGSQPAPAVVFNPKVEVTNQNRAPATQPTLSPREKNGEFFFFQTCSICHLPPLVGDLQGARLPFAPLLYGFMDNPQKEIRVRQIIRDGGVQMPGFQYGLQSDEIENIVAYVKSPAMKTPPEWFAKAKARGIGGGRGGGAPIE